MLYDIEPCKVGSSDEEKSFTTSTTLGVVFDVGNGLRRQVDVHVVHVGRHRQRRTRDRGQGPVL
jgi:hypothetical protein